MSPEVLSRRERHQATWSAVFAQTLGNMRALNMLESYGVQEVEAAARAADRAIQLLEEMTW